MNDEKIKKLANHLSDVFIRNEDEFVDEYDKVKDIKLIYYISILTQVYYNIKVGMLSRADGIKTQEEIFLRINDMRRNE